MEKWLLFAAAFLMLAGGCAWTQEGLREYNFKRDGFDVSRCDPRESGWAWCDARDRAKRGERIRL